MNIMNILNIVNIMNILNIMNIVNIINITLTKEYDIKKSCAFLFSSNLIVVYGFTLTETTFDIAK